MDSLINRSMSWPTLIATKASMLPNTTVPGPFMSLSGRVSSHRQMPYTSLANLLCREFLLMAAPP